MIDGAAIVSVALSSLLIVPVAVEPCGDGRGLRAVVPLTVPRSTVNVSLASTTVSPLIVTDSRASLPPCRRSAAWSWPACSRDRLAVPSAGADRHVKPP